ncbi:MAG: putative lipid II flippase FtsW [Candidatus Moranbacteria bacterium CG10_big_fil_rev_8_21_14_0_10_35_21]|nr:MAG: putative lipid II flippase FtsW [Candidatus Moranbacteria bacterium CG10_big_fil_rev_8_21_14_0_10_35_21]PJA88614.1 MAG: putative lipid II flippase FtsW [Candidatus Moranbacteria bacterium CG_4_9_14_3_um_filter_36_9]
MSKTDSKIDKKLLWVALALFVFGLVMIASAGISYSQIRFDDPYFFFKRQLFGFGIGLVALYFFQKVDYGFWKKISFPLFLGSLVLLVLVFIPGIGTKIYGASRWIKIGPINFQPSEALKFSLIIYLAAWLVGRKERIRDFFEGLAPFVAIISLISFLLIKQPDIGTLGVVILIAMSIFFVSGSKLSHIFLILGGGVASLIILIKLEAYRMNRLLVFLHPELDPRGIGYQINQALLAIGSGGIFGVGLGHSRQKFNYLPEPVGDSIFAIIGEELGLIGCLFLISLLTFVVIRGIKIAKNSPDEFSKLLAVGITAWIFFQSFINIAAISGLIPLTGIPLPFISYGGTSMVFLMAGIGILLNISKSVRID